MRGGRTWVSVVGLLAGMLAVSGVPQAASAQAGQLDLSGRNANFDQVRLTAGFTPDPHRVNGRSGGAINANGLGSACAGWIARRPDHLLHLRSQFGFFKVAVTSDSDTTLVIRTPDGRWLCNDDSNGLNPALQQSSWMRGRYLVWVGSYEEGQVAPYSISFTELQGGGSAGGGGGSASSQLDLSGNNSNFERVRLRGGFTPDPKRASGRSGGAVNATGLGSGCNGWIARQPDHVMRLQGSFNFFRVFANSESDTTLVIRTPNGQWLCNDDSNGLNPMIERNSWRAGRYLIWVGSYEEGAVAPYSIGFTELQNVRD